MVSMQVTLIIAMPVMMYHIIFAGAFVLPKDTPFFMSWMFETDVMKHATDTMLTAVFGWNREKLPCNEMFCFFKRPKDLLKYIGITESIVRSFYFIAGIVFVFHTMTYFNMRKWLKN